MSLLNAAASRSHISFEAVLENELKRRLHITMLVAGIEIEIYVQPPENHLAYRKRWFGGFHLRLRIQHKYRSLRTTTDLCLDCSASFAEGMASRTAGHQHKELNTIHRAHSYFEHYSDFLPQRQPCSVTKRRLHDVDYFAAQIAKTKTRFRQMTALPGNALGPTGLLAQEL